MSKRISELFTIRGSDKEERHGFGDFYDCVAEKIKIKSILEIGVLDGASAFAWMDLNPEICFVGVDMNLCDGVDVIQAVTPGFDPVLARIRRDRMMFDLIIDDGSHDEISQLEGKRLLFEFLNDKGIYIIENAHSGDVRKRFPDANIIDNSAKTGHVDSTIAWWRK